MIDKLKVGDVILFKTKFSLLSPMSWLSSAIRLFTKSNYNHVGLIIESWGELFIIEAVGKGVVIRPAKFVNRKNNDVLVLEPLFYFDSKTISKKITQQLGKSYNYKLLIVEQLWYRLTGDWWGRTNINANQEKSFVCSSLVSWVFNLPEWWKWSAKEFYISDKFKIMNDNSEKD